MTLVAGHIMSAGYKAYEVLLHGIRRSVTLGRDGIASGTVRQSGPKVQTRKEEQVSRFGPEDPVLLMSVFWTTCPGTSTSLSSAKQHLGICLLYISESLSHFRRFTVRILPCNVP